MKPVLFVHGWGFGPDIWRAVADRIENSACVDLGFRGDFALPEMERPIVVGHSMGFAWALAHIKRPWAAAVAVNGFPRFTRADDFPEGLQLRPLQRMRTQFATNPAEVTAAFLSRCGMVDPDVTGIRPDPLAEALSWLTECDERQALAALDCPMVALAGGQDPLISPAMSRAGFPGCQIVEDGCHLLPLTHPERIAALIAGLRP
jgi:pimeloyl-[acyl-carrier protein] methyl ester esterase